MGKREIVVLFGMIATTAIAVVLILEGCTPSPSSTAPPYDVTVTTSDAGADACAIAYEICKARIIRADDGGALCPPCPK
jgi:hypothetical protein